MFKTVLVLGNPLLKQDSLTTLIIPKLQKKLPDWKFVVFDPSENLPQKKELIFLDTVMGIDKVTVFKDLNNFILSPRTTVHDYDLPIDLLLLRKLGKIKQVKIIGLPDKVSCQKIIPEVIKILKAI